MTKQQGKATVVIPNMSNLGVSIWPQCWAKQSVGLDKPLVSSHMAILLLSKELYISTDGGQMRRGINKPDTIARTWILCTEAKAVFISLKINREIFSFVGWKLLLAKWKGEICIATCILREGVSSAPLTSILTTSTSFRQGQPCLQNKLDVLSYKREAVQGATGSL